MISFFRFKLFIQFAEARIKHEQLGGPMVKSIFCFFFILAVAAVTSAADDTNWPCFHGPKRDNLSTETGLMQAWPQNGPKLLWTASRYRTRIQYCFDSGWPHIYTAG